MPIYRKNSRHNLTPESNLKEQQEASFAKQILLSTFKANKEGEALDTQGVLRIVIFQFWLLCIQGNWWQSVASLYRV